MDPFRGSHLPKVPLHRGGPAHAGRCRVHPHTAVRCRIRSRHVWRHRLCPDVLHGHPAMMIYRSSTWISDPNTALRELPVAPRSHDEITDLLIGFGELEAA